MLQILLFWFHGLKLCGIIIPAKSLDILNQKMSLKYLKFSLILQYVVVSSLF